MLIADVAGDYVVELVVFDGGFFSAPDSLTVSATGVLNASETIGSAGGAVGLPDGASVLVPPGALGNATPVNISTIPLPTDAILPPTGVLAGSVYSMQPDGLTFNHPAQIIIPYDPTAVP